MTRGLHTHTVCIEGPDLSGKTTLYRDLHKLSGFKWNIQDRSEVSMLCFSKFYNRGDETKWKSALDDRLRDMNHRYVLLLPDLELLEKRYTSRGDEIHTFESLCETYEIFDTEFRQLEKYPNVLFIRVTSENENNVVATVYEWLAASERETIIDLAHRFERSAAANEGEVLGAHAQYMLDKEYSDTDSTVMEYEPEREYYQGIRDQFLRKISREISGDNEFATPQNPQRTRRFVYAHDSCISMINCIIRNNRLSVFAVIRSSNTRDTLSYDLRFITNLISEAESFFDTRIDERVLHVSIHSAHIIN